MLTNTRESWGSISKAFHWMIAILIVLEVPAGYLMSYTYGLAYRDKGAQPLANFASQIHHTNGLLILLLVIGRLAWRLSGPRPAPIADRFARQGLLAGMVHGTLYALLLIVPLSGWAALSVYGLAPIWLFGFKGVVPSILPVVPLRSPFGYGTFAHIHLYALYVGATVLSVHVGAALWRHWVFQDDVLVRMWPLGRARNKSTASP